MLRRSTVSRVLCYTQFVKARNVTISLDDETARWVRVEAAKQDMSVSKLITALLRRQMANDGDYDAAMRSFLSRVPRPLKEGGRFPTREDMHDRAVLR